MDGGESCDGIVTIVFYIKVVILCVRPHRFCIESCHQDFGVLLFLCNLELDDMALVVGVV